MIQFIKPAPLRVSYDVLGVGGFIYEFNKQLSLGITRMNTGLTPCKVLDDEEFEMAVECAKNAGMLLTREDDNYNTVTYTLKVIE